MEENKNPYKVYETISIGFAIFFCVAMFFKFMFF